MFSLVNEKDTCVEDGLMGDKIFKFMRPVLFDPGDVFKRLGGEGDFRIVGLDFHLHL